jgi:hypothetical protein
MICPTDCSAHLNWHTLQTLLCACLLYRLQEIASLSGLTAACDISFSRPDLNPARKRVSTAEESQPECRIEAISEKPWTLSQICIIA